MALGIAKSIASERHLPISFRSAGLLPGGRPATEEGVQAMAEQGIDISSHISTTLGDALSLGPDLVIAMANNHLRETVSRDPMLWTRTFTLKEFVQRASSMGSREGSVKDYMIALGRGRAPSEMASALPSDNDIEDPVGRPMSEYRRCAGEIRSLVEEMIEHLYPRVGELD